MFVDVVCLFQPCQAEPLTAHDPSSLTTCIATVAVASRHQVQTTTQEICASTGWRRNVFVCVLTPFVEPPLWPVFKVKTYTSDVGAFLRIWLEENSEVTYTPHLLAWTEGGVRL